MCVHFLGMGAGGFENLVGKTPSVGIILEPKAGDVTGKIGPLYFKKKLNCELITKVYTSIKCPINYRRR